MLTLIIATRNAHKVGELRAMLPDKFRFLTLRDFPAAPEVVEDANSFSGNAVKKSVQLSRWLAANRDSNSLSKELSPDQTFILADDSGLEVDALGGAPGIHSARFAAIDSGTKGNSPDLANNKKLLRLLASVPIEKRWARFRCVLALTPLVERLDENNSTVCLADEAELRTEIFEGVCEGQIDFAPSGEGGFGYDPLFIPKAFDKSFSELGDAEKNKISHRAKALEKLKHRLACFNSA